MKSCRTAERRMHFVAVGPLDHTAQQGCDPFVFGDEYLFDQIFDLVAHSRPVFGSEARFGSYAGQRVLFAASTNLISRRRFSFFSSVSATGVELSSTTPSSRSGYFSQKARAT